MPIRPKKSIPEKVTTRPKMSIIEAAQTAVDNFEEEHENLLAMKTEFRDRFPEADVFLQDIARQEDLVRDKIQMAIPLVRDAKQSVGEFKCQLKKSTASYDDKEFAILVTGIEEGGDILMALMEEGYVKTLKLDPGVANYFAQHPHLAKYFETAWRDSEDLTPAITAPKI